ALAACAQWRLAGHEVSIAVNMSERSLVDPKFAAEVAAEVAAELAARGLPGHALTLELTESTIMSDPARTLALLTELHHMGVRLSIDDFGTGYSSLSRLKRLPVHEVKIDCSFVTDMRHDVDNAVIVRSIIDLADNLALTVVAEGVEDDETCGELGRMGCHEAQGYFLSCPMPVADLIAWFGTRGVAPAAVVPRPRPVPAGLVPHEAATR
ncbi:MAG: EAL domain-containing protein, partial [Actinomycetota bacterium]|nr:EAL domain-containing protein [Actinomycetota bacterium]